MPGQSVTSRGSWPAACARRLDLRHPLEKRGASKRLEGGLDGCHRRGLRSRRALVQGIEVTGLQRVVGQHRPDGRQQHGSASARQATSIGVVRMSEGQGVSSVRQGPGPGDGGAGLVPFFRPLPVGLPPAVHQVARRLRHTSAPGEILQGLQQPGVVCRVQGVHVAFFALPIDGPA